MAWTPQDESTFRDRIVRIEKHLPKQRQRGVTARLPFTSILVMGAALIGIKAMVLASVSEGAYRAAAQDLAQEGPVGQVLAVIFGPDPVSLELARHIRF